MHTYTYHIHAYEKKMNEKNLHGIIGKKESAHLGLSGSPSDTLLKQRFGSPFSITNIFLLSFLT